MNRFRVAIVGCGVVAHRHVRRLVEDPRVQVDILCDPSQEQAQKLAPFVPAARIVTSDNDALDPQQIDAALLCSPTTLHHEQASRALERGIHLLIEKPIASNIDQTRDLLCRRDRSGRLVGVSYQRRFEPIYKTARREIQENASLYGRLREIHVFVCERWSQTIPGTWRDDPAFSGGFFADAGSHQIDVCQFITGQRPLRVRAAVDQRDRRVAIITLVQSQWTGGIQLVAHFVGDAQHWREEILFHGEHADLVLRNGQEIERWADNRMTRIIHQEAGSSPDREFIDVLSRGPSAYASYACPAEVGLVMAGWNEAVLHSAQSGQDASIEL
jgi:predicted dehydrogenase